MKAVDEDRSISFVYIMQVRMYVQDETATGATQSMVYLETTQNLHYSRYSPPYSGWYCCLTVKVV